MGFFDKMFSGLSKTRKNIEELEEVFRNYDIDDIDFYDELEEMLIMADVGGETTAKIMYDYKHILLRRRIMKGRDAKAAFVEYMQDMLGEMDTELKLKTKPSVILMVGVNGVGKTTTIGKLAARYKAMGKKVMIGAADTFRAAAVEQLEIWAGRAGVSIVKQGMGSDPASVAFDTVKSAVAKDMDVVLIDTAGRLHNRTDLMNELTKIRNVMRKVVPDAPHEVLLVLDASTGQNAYQQAREFSRATDITSLAITKLDGTAKGGVVIGIVDQLKVPVKFIGVGEGVEDLKVFDRKEFVSSIFSREDIEK